MSNDVYLDVDWRKLETDIWELAYESDGGHLLYIRDGYKNNRPFNQTALEDWSDERYELNLREAYRPSDAEKTLQTSNSWDEIEQTLEQVVEGEE